MKPRPFIALASGILGGPGRGLVQFLNNGGLDGCDPLLGAYVSAPDYAESEYIRAMRATGAPVALLRQQRKFDYGLVGQAERFVREHGATALESNGYKSHVLCWLLRRKTGLPWIAVVHGWTRENLKMRAYTAIEQIMLPLADQVVAVSESLKRRILPPARAKCLVIPNAVDPAEWRAGPGELNPRASLRLPAGAVLAGVVGRLSPEKGQMIFVRALALARAQNPLICGLIVGDGQDRPGLEAAVSAAGLEPYCFFTGYTTEVAPWYRAMDILAMPSFSEGMPCAALEGMCLGLPLLASHVGGVPEVVLDNRTGLLLPPGDAEALASALLVLAGNPIRRQAMGEAGRQRALEHFSARDRAARLLSLYARLSGREKGGRR